MSLLFLKSFAQNPYFLTWAKEFCYYKIRVWTHLDGFVVVWRRHRIHRPSTSVVSLSQQKTKSLTKIFENNLQSIPTLQILVPWLYNKLKKVFARFMKQFSELRS